MLWVYFRNIILKMIVLINNGALPCYLVCNSSTERLQQDQFVMFNRNKTNEDN